MNRIFWLNIVVILLLSACSATAQRSLSRANIGIGYGVWKPSSLDDYPSRPLKNVEGADPYVALIFTTPLLKSHSIRFSLMQWKQRGLKDIGLDYVILRHLAVDLQYYILPEYTVSPYASYGLATIWSREQAVDSNSKRSPLDRAGWGVNVGAGIDFMITSKIAMGLEYQYLYALFAKRVGLTSNYSGPKFSAKIFYVF